MTSHILRIKTVMPPLDMGIVARDRILAYMSAGLVAGSDFTRQLTLLSAPAGYGKTTLVRSWLDTRDGCCAWLSIDEADNDESRFWTYLIAALRAGDESVGRGALELLQSSGGDVGGGSGRTDFLTLLLNDLFSLERPLILVIDDYHLIHDSAIHDQMRFFIENIPPAVHLVITTRSDPPWPLSRWRGRNVMLEIRLNTLSFSQAETALLLTGNEQLHLSDSQVQLLHKKTEGWVAGLKLAALSLAAAQDQSAFVEQFAGSSRQVLQFLFEEVFAKQAVEVQDFLLKTCILTRFSADLCDAVTQGQNSADRITFLEKSNLFIIPLDEQGVWYRYHPLFADMLAVRLKSRHATETATLYRLAGDWHLERKEPAEAARLLIAGKLTDEAAAIIHNYYDDILQAEGPSFLYLTLHHFPDSLKMKYPRLMVHMILYALIYFGQAQARRYLDLAQTLIYPKETEQREYEGMLAATKAYYHIFNHEFEQAEKHAATALALLSPHNHYWRMNTAIYLGDARLFSGQAKQALPYYEQAQISSRVIGNQLLQINTGFKVAFSLSRMGRLKEAESLIQTLLGEAKAAGLAGTARAGLLWTLYGELLREKGNLAEAEPAVERGVLLSEPEKPCLGWNYLFEADLFLSQRQFEAAMQTLTEIELLDNQVNLPDFITFPAAIRKARLLLLEGQRAAAKNCLAEIGISETAAVHHGEEEGFLILSEIMLTENTTPVSRMKAILSTVSEQSLEGGCVAHLLETRLLLAELAVKEGETDRGRALLLEALSIGSDAGYFQFFADRRERLLKVVERLTRAGENPLDDKQISSRLRQLLLIHPKKQDPDLLSGIAGSSGPAMEAHISVEGDASMQDLVENLSPREQEILDLINQGLSNQDISEKLFLSLGTVKWHTSNIYSKLGVRGRTQAIARARQLRILS